MFRRIHNSTLPRQFTHTEGVSLDDEVWCLAIQAHLRNQEGYRETAFSEADQHLLRAINLGIYDQTWKPMDAATRAMRHSSAMADMLLEMLEKERAQVSAAFS